MSTTSAVAPVIAMLKETVAVFFVLIAIYAVFLFGLKRRIDDARKFIFYKQLGSVAVILVMAGYVFLKMTHR